MRRLLLIVCAALVAATPALAPAQTVDQPPAAGLNSSSPPAPPAARLIKPRQGKGEARAIDKSHPRLGPVDDRCKPLKLQLDGELTHSSNPHKAFQAKLARNAGTRLCRDGQVEKGMAEFRKGLSYLETAPQQP